MWDYELKTLPRPKGKETQVIYTTWELPLTSRPHDTRIGLDGAIWFNHFNDNAHGASGSEDGRNQTVAVAISGDEGSFEPTGARTMMGPDRQGRFYIGNQAQDGLVVFDPKTETFSYPDVPGGGEMMDVSASRADGYGWRVGSRCLPDQPRNVGGDDRSRGRSLSAATILPRTPRTTCTARAGAARTCGASTPRRVRSPTTTSLRSRVASAGFGGGMRRGIRPTAQDRLWWGGFDGNFIGMLDPKQPSGKEIRLWEVPFPWFSPYDAHHDDRGLHLDRRNQCRPRRPAECRFGRVELLPAAVRSEHSRHRPATRRAERPLRLWIGHAHQGLITLVEPWRGERPVESGNWIIG